jgi:hypothetical protein
VYKLYKLFLNFTYALSLKGPFEAAYKGSSPLGRIQYFASVNLRPPVAHCLVLAEVSRRIIE